MNHLQHAHARASTSSMRRARVPSSVALVLVLGLLSACGGGGGGGTPPPEPEPFIDGLSGTVMLPDFDLGRTIEQEPNDSRSQPFALAPLWPRCTHEVTGTLGATATRYGRIDTQDVLRIASCVDQRIDLSLAFLETDPVDGGDNDVVATVFDVASGLELAMSTLTGNPRTLSFDAAAYVAYDLVISLTTGHAWYTATLTGSDLPGPVLLTAPTIARGDASPSAPVSAKPSACSREHVLVRFEDGCDPAAFCATQGLELGRRLATGSYVVHVPCDGSGHDEAAMRKTSTDLTASDDVRWAEPDWVIRTLSTPTDPLYNRQWNLPMVGAPSAWDMTTGDASIVVGIVDSGILPHPDLLDGLVEGYDFISDPVRAGDGDGRDPDPTDPGNQVDGSGLSNWHGTHVAGIVGARQDNGVGGCGVAPGVSVMMLRALGIGGGLVSDAVDAILFAAGLYTTPHGRTLESPLQILNLSIGLPQDAADLRDACSRASNNGVLLVGAVGNDGGGVLYPAAYDSVFAVAAVDGAMNTTAYSNFGDAVDLAAPGGAPAADIGNDGWPDGIFSCVRDETVSPAVDGYGYIIGTSQAAPHVAGAAALLLSIDPSLTATQLKNMLRGTALDRGPIGEDVAYGAGVLQVHEAVKMALAGLGTPRTDAPVLLLPIPTCQFEDFGRVTIRRELPLFNGGSGRLNLLSVISVTDDGAPWLDASFTPADGPGDPVNQKEVVITINRNVVGASIDGRYSGSVILGNLDGAFGEVRVVMYVNEQTRAGRDLPVVAIEDATGIARRKTFATADRGYRYWFRNLTDGEYRLQAGEDLDGNGFMCEAFEACGWFGGPTELDAELVPYALDQPAVQGLGIDLVPQPAPSASAIR